MGGRAGVDSRRLEPGRHAFWQLATDRFKAGLESYLDVVTARRRVLFNESTAAQISGQRLLDTVVLIKALGGGGTRS